MIRAPMETSLSTKNSRLSNIFSKISTVPRAWVATIDGDRGQVGRERRPRPVLDLRDLAAEVVADRQLLAGRDADACAVDLDLNPEPLERRQDRDEVLRRRRRRS